MNRRAQNFLSGLLLGVALALGLATVPWPGSSDVPQFWLPWMGIIRTHGLVEGYARCFTDYTPLSSVFLWAIAHLADQTGWSDFLLLKAGITLFAWASAFLFWRRSHSIGLTAAFLLVLVLVSSAQGYLDVLYLPPLLLAFGALETRRIVAAAFWLAVATSVKWQPLLIAPFFVLAAWKPAKDIRPATSIPAWQQVLLGALPIALLMVVGFGPVPLARSLLKAVSHPALSYQALNPAWLVQGALAHKQLAATTPPYELVAPAYLAFAFKAAFFSTYAFLLYNFWRHGRSFGDFLWHACIGACAYFTLNTGVHENHLFIALALALASLATHEPAGRLLTIYCSLMLNLNLALFNGFDGVSTLFGGGRGSLAVILCLSNAAFLMACLMRTLRLRREIVPAPHADPLIHSARKADAAN